jgi:hypothetical protein
MSSQDDQEMVQLQNGRIVSNWRRMNDAEYPRWTVVLPKFFRALDTLRATLAGQGLAGLRAVQWEVTYVNHFLKGRDWNEPRDWLTILPAIVGKLDRLSVGSIESAETTLHYLLPGESVGRLHAEMHHGFLGADSDAAEIVVLQLTARGGLPPSPADDDAIRRLLQIGHDAIVVGFCELTSAEAQARWERTS